MTATQYGVLAANTPAAPTESTADQAVFDPYLSTIAGLTEGVTVVDSLDALLRQADFL